MIKVYNGSELVRTFTEAESDERADYKDKAVEFAKKNGYSIGKEGKEVKEEVLGGAEELQTQVAPTEPKAPVAPKVAKPKATGKKK